MRIMTTLIAFGFLAMLMAVDARPVQAAGWERYIPKGPGRHYYNKYGKPWVDRYTRPKRQRKSRSRNKQLQSRAVIFVQPPPPPVRNVQRTNSKWNGGYVY